MTIFGPIVEGKNGLMNKLKGRKSYICAIVLFCLGGSYSLGWINREQFESLSIMVAGLLGISLRVALANK